MKHINGHPVGQSAYINHGCRCDGCRAARAAYMRNYRTTIGHADSRRQNKLRQLCAAWVRETDPELYERFKAEAREWARRATR